MKTTAGEAAVSSNASSNTYVAFKHFGPLEKQKMGAGPKLASTALVAGMLSLLILFSLAHAKEIREEIKKAEITFIAPEEPPPPPPPLHIPPPPPDVTAPPKIVVPQNTPVPVMKTPEIHMKTPVPVIQAAPPKLVTPPPAPKMVALNVAPASVPNNYNKPSAVALGDPHALRAAPNAKSAPNAVSLGIAGMPARNTGAGAAGARSVSLGSGYAQGTPGGTDRGRPVSGVALGVTNGQGSGPVRSASAVAISGPAPAAATPRPVSAAPTTAAQLLSTPHPAYTPEARSKGINGTVDVEVIFHANGSVQVIRVVRGLGYGLDQNAMIAAANIRFKPAMQSGQPVDQHSIVHIVFQMIS